jgi:hypothetical protein
LLLQWDDDLLLLLQLRVAAVLCGEPLLIKDGVINTLMACAVRAL